MLHQKATKHANAQSIFKRTHSIKAFDGFKFYLTFINNKNLLNTLPKNFNVKMWNSKT
jgi:hypothetical protein